MLFSFHAKYLIIKGNIKIINLSVKLQNLRMTYNIIIVLNYPYISSSKPFPTDSTGCTRYKNETWCNIIIFLLGMENSHTLKKKKIHDLPLIRDHSHCLILINKFYFIF